MGFVTKMSENRKSTSFSAIEENNRRKKISTEDRLDVICQHKKGEKIVDICRNVKLARNNVRTIRDNAHIIRESAQSVTKVFV